MKPLSENPSNSTPLSEQELREKLLKDYKVSKVSVTISQKIYSNNTVSPVEMKNQDIVEIGIDDLVDLILSDRKAWGEYLASTDVDLTHADTPEKGARYLREALREYKRIMESKEKELEKELNTKKKMLKNHIEKAEKLINGKVVTKKKKDN